MGCFQSHGDSLYGWFIKENLTLWLFNIAMEAMAPRNRWFTMVYLFKMGIVHGYVK